MVKDLDKIMLMLELLSEKEQIWKHHKLARPFHAVTQVKLNYLHSLSQFRSVCDVTSHVTATTGCTAAILVSVSLLLFKKTWGKKQKNKQGSTSSTLKYSGQKNKQLIRAQREAFNITNNWE